MTQNQVGTIADFIDGERDCRDGKPADPSRSDRYKSGYGCRYELDECIHMSNKQRAKHGLG